MMYVIIAGRYKRANAVFKAILCAWLWVFCLANKYRTVTVRDWASVKTIVKNYLKQLSTSSLEPDVIFLS